MCVARLTVQRYGIFGAGANFPAQKQGCFSKHTQFFCGPVFVARNSGTVEQITVEQKKVSDNSGTEMKVPENSGTGNRQQRNRKKFAGAAEQGTDNSGTEIKVPEESAQDFI